MRKSRSRGEKRESQVIMFVIPAIWEVKKGRFWFKASPGEKSCQNPIMKNKLGLVVCACKLS
jgi:hypothetical protein